MSVAALPIDVRSVATARGLLLAALDGHSKDTVDDALLMISELVSNAVRHTRTVLLVGVTIGDHMLRVDVTDDNPTLPVARDPEQEATGGRGLRIVDALATRWGITPTAEGKTVWFETQLTPHSGQQRQVGGTTPDG